MLQGFFSDEAVSSVVRSPPRGHHVLMGLRALVEQLPHFLSDVAAECASSEQQHTYIAQKNNTSEKSHCGVELIGEVLLGWARC